MFRDWPADPEDALHGVRFGEPVREAGESPSFTTDPAAGSTFGIGQSVRRRTDEKRPVWPLPSPTGRVPPVGFR